MSIAGIRSNRGDIYQTLIAFDWALTVLSDPDYQWLEVDSVNYPVDDVVIGKNGGSLICCQCKKNQPNFSAWSISDLGEELDKAFLALAHNHQPRVRFYSRGNFGKLAKLQEFCSAFENESDYIANLTAEHKKTDKDLSTRLSAKEPSLTSFDFLKRTSFEVTPEFDRMEALLLERLRNMASNSNAAFDALWTRLDNLGGRVNGSSLSAATQYRLTKDNLRELIHNSGAMLVPRMSIAEVKTSFSGTSSVGRYWLRDIAGQRISRPILDEVLAAIEEKKKSILITGLPGSGKTCVMLSLQEALEQRSRAGANMVPLFIQSREFADFATPQERQAQGLPEEWVEQTSRLAEDAHVVVVIDSLDVLSIAREHNILTYFLAQIDQLLMIPNVTVVTACRDFDRKYDRRISVRKWACEFQCTPLDWTTEIEPLFNDLGIDSTAIDTTTRELIKNPRELALFVELAQRMGSFSVVTGQALAQRYLDTIVREELALGDVAMQAIEAIAAEMLKARSLSIPYQRLNAPQEIVRRLLSLNVLQSTHDGKLTFGHQTLLDVLVISGSVRRGISLAEFIQSLPPVPFVRPSIRSFVAQIAEGERREFRRQIRAVLAGDAAFHIRRLIAESLVQQPPHDDDWSLIRDLRNQHREVFQVIYSQASSTAWHYFWSKHLVPLLKEERDAESMTGHVYRVTQWKNEDAAGVFEFWMDALGMDWLDSNRIAEQLSFYLDDIREETLPLAAPLVLRLLGMPRSEHCSLGHILARCVMAGVLDDEHLWAYIAGEIQDDDVTSYHFNNKLRCQPHEFREKQEGFLKQRMLRSTRLLDMAVAAIEQWSQVRARQYRQDESRFYDGFLSRTSYEINHSQGDGRHVDSEHVLFDAVENAILNHALNCTEWWQSNREKVCFSREGALRYFSVVALTNSPHQNIDLISSLLRDANFLESSLSYEIANLIKSAFIYLEDHEQDAVMETIMTIWEESNPDEGTRRWILQQRAQYISAIPCHLRSVAIQAILGDHEKVEGPLIRQPNIHSRGGTVAAPFSFEVFLSASDESIISLLTHYTGYKRDYRDFLIGGERQVGNQLDEASSRHPLRFLRLLVSDWPNISASFCNNIMCGISRYLAHCFGNLQAHGNWVPLDEPDPIVLASEILDELERHLPHWGGSRSAAKALEACAYVINDTHNAARLVFLAIGFAGVQEERNTPNDTDDLISAGINMTSGNATEALMVLAERLHEKDMLMPELLPAVLRRFAKSEDPAIRALILRRLPYLQYKNPRLGWQLFDLAMRDSTGLWRSAERCLYYSYHSHFEKVAPLLERIRGEGGNKEMKTWGRISALAAMTGHIDFDNLVERLRALDVCEAWEGAVSVWAHTTNIRQHRSQCLAGIEAGLHGPHAIATARRVKNIFRDETPPISIPTELIALLFSVFTRDSEDKHNRLFEFHRWLNATSQRDPEAALAATEIYLDYVHHAKPHMHDHENQLVQLTTRLFAEAEEREGIDQGEMLRRVVEVQDKLLSLGVTSVDHWLKAAERQ